MGGFTFTLWFSFIYWFTRLKTSLGHKSMHAVAEFNTNHPHKASFPADRIFREERYFSLFGDLSGATDDHDT